MSVPDVSPEVKAVGDAIYRLSIRTLPRVNLPTTSYVNVSSRALQKKLVYGVARVGRWDA